MKKVWKVKNKAFFNDNELIDAIKNKVVNEDDLIICDSLKQYIKVKDSIYQFYIKGKEDETL